MTENKHGFTPKQEITLGGISWTIIETGEDWVKCLASKCVQYLPFDEDEERNGFDFSELYTFLKSDLIDILRAAGVPRELFLPVNIDLTCEDGRRDFGETVTRMGLITCEEYRRLRGNIPEINDIWWTATADSPKNDDIRCVHEDGTLVNRATTAPLGVRPLCKMDSAILRRLVDEKRQKAVELMQHIAAAWDITAGEVFGGTTE